MLPCLWAWNGGGAHRIDTLSSSRAFFKPCVNGGRSTLLPAAHSRWMTRPRPSGLSLSAPGVSPSALVGRTRTNTLTRSAGVAATMSYGWGCLHHKCSPPRSPGHQPARQRCNVPPSGLSFMAVDGRRLPEVAVSSELSRLAAPPVLVGEREAVALPTE